MYSRFNIAKIKFKWKIVISLLLLVLLTETVSFIVYYNNRILPGIKVAGVYVGGLTKQEAQELLLQKVILPEKLTLIAKEKVFELSLSEVEVSYDYKKSIDQAFSFYRTGSILKDTYSKFYSLFDQKEIDLVTYLNKDKLNEYLQVVSSQVAIEPVYPSALYKNGEIIVEKGRAGENIDTDELQNQLIKKLSIRDYSPYDIPFSKKDPSLTQKEAELLAERAKKLIGKTILLKSDDETIVYEDAVLISLLNPENGYSRQNIQKLIQEGVLGKINREPQNAVFRFENGKVIEFLQAKDGLAVNEENLENEIFSKLLSLETSEEKEASIQIPVKRAPPAITTDQVNNLGIKELLGRGYSTFKGSIPGRVHNISLASSKINGVLVPPDTVFSFNDAIGDVSVYTGYKQAYIIKDGRTVLGDGGGVCQVSTTLFRAVLNAGLPVIERKAHSYRVSYYEQGFPPGLDATVYAPATDLKFKNDTPAHLLIQAIFDAKASKLTFEIYGTSDGRIATTTKPVIVSSIIPPEDLYIDDPSLPTGQIKQIDYKAWGAKVIFDYKVERNGETIFEKQFVSNYRPWQAVFLRGTAPTQ